MSRFDVSLDNILRAQEFADHQTQLPSELVTDQHAPRDLVAFRSVHASPSSIA